MQVARLAERPRTTASGLLEAAMTSSAPTARVKSAVTDVTWYKGRTQKYTSSWANCMARSSMATRASRAPCDRSTPLGRSVVPLVYKRRAPSSGATPGPSHTGSAVSANVS